MLVLRRRRLLAQAYPNLGAQFTAASSQYASIADNPSVSTGDIDFSLGTWAMADSSGASKILLAKSAASGQREFFLQFSSTNFFSFGVYTDGVSFVSVTATTFGALPPGTWAFVLAWHDSVLNTLNIQVNDGAVNSVAHTLGVFDSTASLMLGSNNGISQFHNGRMDSAFLSKRVYSAAERTQLYNSNIGLAYRDLDAGLKTSLISWWDLDGNFVDRHGINHMTAVNGPTFVGGKR